MLKIISAIATAMLLSNAAHGAQVRCGVAPKDVIFTAEKLWYKVAGSGRLYLYAGPDEKCLDKNLFVIHGDSLVAYKEYGRHSEWSFVIYTAKSGRVVDGWVHTNRLQFTGASGSDMTADAVKFYAKAAEAAKKGKLGRPA